MKMKNEKTKMKMKMKMKMKFIIRVFPPLWLREVRLRLHTPVFFYFFFVRSTKKNKKTRVCASESDCAQPKWGKNTYNR